MQNDIRKCKPATNKFHSHTLLYRPFRIRSNPDKLPGVSDSETVPHWPMRSRLSEFILLLFGFLYKFLQIHKSDESPEFLQFLFVLLLVLFKIPAELNCCSPFDSLDVNEFAFISTLPY